MPTFTYVHAYYVRRYSVLSSSEMERSRFISILPLLVKVVNDLMLCSVDFDNCLADVMHIDLGNGIMFGAFCVLFIRLTHKGSPRSDPGGSGCKCASHRTLSLIHI